MKNLLVANRGEIAVRIIRAANELNIGTVAVFSEDDATSLHTKKADGARALVGSGPRAYLDIEGIISIAREAGCDAIHPGYGFLSESAAFSRRCAEEGITFVGPRAETLELLGNKAQARTLAEENGIPVIPGTKGPTTLEEVKGYFSGLGEGVSIMIKAIGGGGGRGMRAVSRIEDIEEAFTRCQSEARQAFGNSELYVEQLIPRSRHIEVQIVCDSLGGISDLGERECSIQRRYQKMIEVAPSPGLSAGLRQRLIAAAARIAEAANYENIGSFEFLVDATSMDLDDAPFYFIESNARLQVEHTVTEEVTGIDLVQTQLELAAGRSLQEVGLAGDGAGTPKGYAMQARINMETMTGDGTARPSGGVLTAFEMPSGLGVRSDSFGYAGYRVSPNFDSLLAKVVGHSRSSEYSAVISKTYRALCETRIEGVPTNIPFLQSILQHPDFINDKIHTRFIDENIADLVSASNSNHRKLFFEQAPVQTREKPQFAGARIDASDPLAVLDHGKSDEEQTPSMFPSEPMTYASAEVDAGPEGTVPIRAPVQGTIVSVSVAEGDQVTGDTQVAVMESMKMEHEVLAGTDGTVRQVAVAEGDTVYEGHPLLYVEEGAVEDRASERLEEIDLDYIRPDLAELFERRAMTLDAARPEAVEKRRRKGQRTTRENIEDLCDPGSFSEYGGLVIAARRERNTLQELIQRTPADGLEAGIGRVNGHLFDDTRARCAVIGYDYMVLAGTQGKKNHEKKDRFLEVIERARLPLVFFAEGGGGRPGDSDDKGVAGLTTPAFTRFAKLSGLVPVIGITSGRCFAGNAVLLGCCDVIIATANSNIGLGGPAMIEGGGLGIFRPEEIGPMEHQVPNGVVDIPVADEAEAVQVAKKYLGYFQGPLNDWDCADQRLLRRAVPENRMRVYDIRSIIEILADTDSVLEIRKHFGHGMVTSLIRVEGRPVGVIANNPTHLGGAVDSDGADKAARFMQLCDAFDIPLLLLIDTPGMMVGPETEKTALLRHSCRLFVTGSSITVPTFGVVLRKAYGLGAQAMAGGCFHNPLSIVAWPTGEFGGMGLEGAVKLGYRKELAAIKDPEERIATYEKMVADMYEAGKAINTASYFELDDVIDPAETRQWILEGLRALPPVLPRSGKKRPNVDTW